MDFDSLSGVFLEMNPYDCLLATYDTIVLYKFSLYSVLMAKSTHTLDEI